MVKVTIFSSIYMMDVSI